MEVFHKYDRWDNPYVSLSDGNKTMRNIAKGLRSTCYGSNTISNSNQQIHRWNFKIVRMPEYTTICIGIDEGNNKQKGRYDVGFYYNKETNNYGYWNDGSKVSKCEYSDYSSKYKEGDTISMILDMANKTLSFGVNNSKIKTAFNDINETNIGYKMAVFTEGEYVTISLRSYAVEIKQKQESKEKEEDYQQEIKTKVKEQKPSKTNAYNKQQQHSLALEQLISMGFDKDMAMTALQTSNYNINIAMQYLQNPFNQKGVAEQKESNDVDASLGEFEELMKVLRAHINYMKQQEGNVNKLILDSSSSDLLTSAKNKALETEKNLFNEILNISNMNTFLNNIIMIENLFNSLYNDQQKSIQQSARNQYAPNIKNYESLKKPQCHVNGFVDLVFRAKEIHIKDFKNWLQALSIKCDEQNIKILSNSGAKGKNIERSFYKSFYVYSAIHGMEGFKHLTDVLRCSLVFDNFKDLYKCFSLIEVFSRKDNNAGILRTKDRFNPKCVPFGYRDLLINIYCPGSNGQIVCEIQLHHIMFYQHKVISHKMYKKARIFDENDENLAYHYADKHVRKIVGNKIYEYEEENKDDENDIDPYELLKDWKLQKYGGPLIDDEGYDDPMYWKEITFDELKSMGFKTGHAKKFVDKASCL